MTWLRIVSASSEHALARARPQGQGGGKGGGECSISSAPCWTPRLRNLA